MHNKIRLKLAQGQLVRRHHKPILCKYVLTQIGQASMAIAQVQPLWMGMATEIFRCNTYSALLQRRIFMDVNLSGVTIGCKQSGGCYGSVFKVLYNFLNSGYLVGSF